MQDAAVVITGAQQGIGRLSNTDLENDGCGAVILSDVFYVGIFYFDLDKVFMDTGALHSSYISRDLVDKHSDTWQGNVMHVDGKDCLGDNKTEVNVTCCCDFLISGR